MANYVEHEKVEMQSNQSSSEHTKPTTHQHQFRHVQQFDVSEAKVWFLEHYERLARAEFEVNKSNKSIITQIILRNLI